MWRERILFGFLVLNLIYINKLLAKISQRFQTSLQHRNELQSAKNMVISGQTIRRCLCDTNLAPRCPVTGPLLTIE